MYRESSYNAANIFRAHFHELYYRYVAIESLEMRNFGSGGFHALLFVTSTARVTFTHMSDDLGIEALPRP